MPRTWLEKNIEITLSSVFHNHKEYIKVCFLNGCKLGKVFLISFLKMFLNIFLGKLSTLKIFTQSFIMFQGIWTSDAQNGTAVLEIGKKLKERLRIPSRTTLGYQVHKDTIEKTGSISKYSYTV